MMQLQRMLLPQVQQRQQLNDEEFFKWPMNKRPSKKPFLLPKH